MSVNLSTEQFSDTHLVAKLQEVVRSAGIEPGSLKIEITESEIMENPKTVSDMLHQLKLLGIDGCLDDFGTGYSSLSYLQQLPITFIKIDQSFVRRLGGEDDALAIVKTIGGVIASIRPEDHCRRGRNAGTGDDSQVTGLRIRSRILILEAAS